MSGENLTRTQNTVKNASESPKKRGKGFDIVAYFLCLLVAFGIWAYVTSTEAEEYEYQFTGVVVDLEGVAALMNGSELSPISGEGQEITVTVKGSRSEISKYSADDIFAYVDLSGITVANRHSLEVHVDLPGNIQLVSAEPAKIPVFVDETIEKQIPVKVDLLYAAADNINVLPPEIDDTDILNGVITVTGPKTIVDYIDHALVKKDLGLVTTGVNFNSQFVLIDKSGDEVTNPYVKTDVNEVSVSVKVKMEKIVSLNATFDVLPDDAYDYTVVWKYDGEVVETVKIVGAPETVVSYDVLNIKINNVSSIQNGSAALPEDVWVYVGENKISTISYTVTKTLRENNG